MTFNTSPTHFDKRPLSFDAHLTRWEGRYKAHTLVEIDGTEDLMGWLLKMPDTMMQSCFIYSTPSGIIIDGDLVPSGRAISGNKPLSWFAAKLSPNYLASKFLPYVWDPITAIEHAHWLVDVFSGVEGHEPEEDLAKNLISMLGATTWSDFEEQRGYEEAFDQWDIEIDDFELKYPRSRPRLEHTAHLAAVQRRFSALYHEGRNS